MINASSFAKLIAEKELGFATIDELCDIADTHEVWTDLLRSDGMRALKKDILRRVMRQKAYDEDGNRIEWVNITQTSKKGGTKPVYKQLDLLNIGEFEELIRDRKKRFEKFEAEFIRFCKIAVAKFGSKIQRRFDFELPIEPVRAGRGKPQPAAPLN